MGGSETDSFIKYDLHNTSVAYFIMQNKFIVFIVSMSIYLFLCSFLMFFVKMCFRLKFFELLNNSFIYDLYRKSLQIYVVYVAGIFVIRGLYDKICVYNDQSEGVHCSFTLSGITGKNFIPVNCSISVTDLQ